MEEDGNLPLSSSLSRCPQQPRMSLFNAKSWNSNWVSHRRGRDLTSQGSQQQEIGIIEPELKDPLLQILEADTGFKIALAVQALKRGNVNNKVSEWRNP